MITKIDIHGSATFSNTAPPIDGLKSFNYFFGVNGTGKTTISNLIAKSEQLPNNPLTWKNGVSLDTRVFNRDFIERNFVQQMKGVFTMGELEADTLTRIDEVKKDIDKLKTEISTLTNTLQGSDGNGGKKQELLKHESDYADTFWVAEQQHKAKLAGGLTGYMGGKDPFKTKVLSESRSNTADLKSLNELEEKAATVFSGTLMRASNITTIQPDKLLSLENAPILGKRIIGKENVDIATIITKLNNSDWVREGKSYFETNDGICPFCQQRTDESFAKSLNEYFDETFERDMAAIKTLANDYTTESERIQQQAQAILDLRSEFVDNEKMASEKNLLDSKIVLNAQRLAQKKKETSQVIELDSLKNVLTAIVDAISAANTKIDAHNAIIQNLDNEKRLLTMQIWKYITEELKTAITAYNSGKSNLTSAIANMESQLQAKNGEMNTKIGELEALEKLNVSVKPALEWINNTLASFGFKSFSLAEGDDGKTYKLVRANGSDAHATLSEGERNFVTFLYFYHLLKGSHEETGLTTDKIVVFDDPVSSLDNDVLFIVSSLIRELYEEVRQSNGMIKQIFVMTHNVYFHKEVAYDTKRRNVVRANESFWLVKKIEDTSFVERQQTNPIKTSYELLWEEIRSEPRNNITIRNTLRRILESYFKLLGDIPLDDLYKEFDGDNKVKCKALCSWVHDGSHPSTFSDEHYTPLDDATVAIYLDVFRQVFDKSGHLAHYNMMMNIQPEEDLEIGEALP